MIRKIVMGAMLIMLTASLFGCGDKDETPATQVNTDVVLNDDNSTNNTTNDSVTNPNEVQDNENDPEAKTENEDATSEIENEGGGNKNNNEATTPTYEFLITISEDVYYYNNEPISLDDLIDEIETVDGEVIVTITDNEATENACTMLTTKLDELEIEYTIN